MVKGTDFRISRPLEVWGGIECTVNRVGERYFDQLEYNGHAAHPEDIEMLAALGLRTLRYPMLWERIAPNGIERADWSWADDRLERLRSLGIRPIVGLVHHGSGPRHTSLIDPEFPVKLAAFARAFAERYPWVDMYTPVNEPLTTARFSGLYGVWYPHGRDVATFATAQLMQCNAIAQAMREIRRVNPDALLVQTEDLGKIHSTPMLTYQAEHENERRWLTFDLLCGLVDDDHPMRGYFERAGLESELSLLLEHPSPPDIIGVNHYVTSERFLDEDLELYPEHLHGGNGKHEYADVEAVRVLAGSAAGPYRLIREAWERYELPIAITEVHLGCTREEQLRWLHEVWDAAVRLRSEGVDLRAITSWSLLGAFNWHCLLTRDDGHYEPGAFDLRAPKPRPTALARMIRELATTGRFDHPLLTTPGWWRRPERLIYDCVHEGPDGCETTTPQIATGHLRQPLLITGATGTLGRAFARACERRGIDHILLTRQEMDITSAESVDLVMSELRPWGVINAAGYVRVDEAENDAERCRRENTCGPELLARACDRYGASLVTFSTDLVFDGMKGSPYLESDHTAPLNVYGCSKAEMERRVLGLLPGALVIRTSAFFGPWDEHNFVTRLLRALHAGEAFTAAADAIVSPTYVPDLVHATLDLLIDGESGIWHLTNGGAVSWSDLAHRVAAMAKLDPSRIVTCRLADLGLAARRPAYSALASERGGLMPSLDDALKRYARDLDPSDRILLFPDSDALEGTDELEEADR